MTSEEALRSVHDFWNVRSCGEALYLSGMDGSAYRAQSKKRYELEPFIKTFADAAAMRGRDVLEVGVGLGADHQLFAEAGARLTGIDLTERAIEHVRRRFDTFCLSSDLRVADAENLPFADASFDLVYSWGVLHHTPDTARALAEVRRVLRPAGEARVMLYARRSLFAGAVWARQVVRERRLMGAQVAIARGLESPGTQAFTRAEAAGLFAGFAAVEVRQVATSYDRVPIDRLGWHFLVRARR